MTNKIQKPLTNQALELTRDENFLNGTLDIMDILAVKNEKIIAQYYESKKASDLIA